VGFITAVQSGLRNYARFSGRATRSEYWWWFLFSVLVQGIISVLSENLGYFISFALLLPSMAVAVRRMHDTDHRGWWALIPIVNFVFALSKSDASENRFGRPYGYIEPAAPVTDVARTQQMPPPAPISSVRHQFQKSEKSDEVKYYLCGPIAFSHNPSAQFSLQTEMSRAGFKDIQDFESQLLVVLDKPEMLDVLAGRVASIRGREVFRTVVARLLNALSYNYSNISESDVEGWVATCQLFGCGFRDPIWPSSDLLRIIKATIVESLKTRGEKGMLIVQVLEENSHVWESNTDSSGSSSDNPESARKLLSGVVILAIIHSLTSENASLHLVQSLSGNKVPQKISLREEMQLLTEIGRAFARSNGIDYDDFVRNHFNIK
jgi:hypothetical protein